MSTYVFLNISARGHINPTLPIVKELGRRGEKVIYFVAEEYREVVEAVGAKFQALPPLTRPGGTGVNSAEPPGDKQIAVLPFIMAWQSTQVIPQLVENIRGIKADCLVYNAMSLWGRLSAHLLGIPAVGFRPFHAPRIHRSVVAPFASERLARLAAAADRELDQLARSFEQPSRNLHELVSEVEELTLVFMPKEFQFEAEAFDERFLFVGPSLFDDDAPERWPFEQPATDERLRAYISLGTLRNNEPEFYRTCFSAFNRREWQVVMSVGNQIDLASLQPFPDNFAVVRSVPQIALLPSVDVFVTHGGLNSTMESLYFGVHLVVVPSIGEQRLTASRVQELGLGIVLDHETLTPESLRRSARAVARDPGIRARVKAMQHKARTAGGFMRATEAIHRFATRG